MAHPSSEGAHDNIGEHIDLPPELDDTLKRVAPDEPITERWPGTPVHDASAEDQAGSYEQNIRNLSADEAIEKNKKHETRSGELNLGTKTLLGTCIKRYFRLDKTIKSEPANPDHDQIFRGVGAAHENTMDLFNQYLEHEIDATSLEASLNAFSAELDQAEDQINPGFRQAA